MKYRSQNKNRQLTLDIFQSSLDDLDKSNRWVVLGDTLPWAELEKVYNSKLHNKDKVTCNKPASMVIAAMIIKHKMSLSDEEIIRIIQENPYLQYMCGLSELTDQPIFDPSLFVTVRKRITDEEINEMTVRLLEEQRRRRAEAEQRKDKADDGNAGAKNGNGASKEENMIDSVGDDTFAKEFKDTKDRLHKGVLKMDATCANAEVRYPVDVDIIHDGCKVVDRYIHSICKALKTRDQRTSYKDVRRADNIQEPIISISFKMIKMKSLITAILAFVSLQAMAQEITGKIVDEKQQPVSFANIAVLSETDSTLLGGTISDENGAFKLEKLEKGNILKTSFVGYRTCYTHYTEQAHITITLESDSKMLQEVVVKSALPKTVLKGESMTTNIAGTILEKTSSIYQMLNLVPMVSVQNESITVLGRGTPLIYIDGRTMQSATELQTLRPEDIKKVEVICNPGAKYPAATTCVLRIITHRNRNKNLGISNQFTSRLNEKYQMTWTDVLRLSNQTTHWDFNVYLFSEINKRPDDKQMRQHTLAGDSWLQITDIAQTYKNVNPYGKLSASYLLNDSNSIGASVYYDRYAHNGGKGTSDVAILKNGYLDERTFSEYHSSARSKNFGSNLYYYGKLGKFGIDFNTDYMWYGKKEPMDTHEAYTGTDAIQHIEDVNTHRRTYNRLMASKLVLSYPVWNGILSWGVEGSKTNRKEYYSVLPENKVSNVSNHISEIMQAVMVDYSRQIGALSVQAGLRYEYLNFKFYDYDVLQEEASKKYNDIFPSVALSMPVGKTQMQLSYGVDVSRPGYSDLRSGVQYDNRFTYEGGNPLLRPTFTKNISYSLSWKWITFTSMVQHYKNEIAYLSRYYNNDPRILILNPVNMPSYNKFVSNLSLQPKIGIYQLSFNAQLSKQWYKMDISDGNNINAPLINFNITNTFDTKWATLSLGFQANTRGGDGNIYLRKAAFATNFSAYKQLLKGRLTISFYAYDIFGTNNKRFTLYSGPNNWTEFDNYSCSYVQLSVKYQFNLRNSKYKGTGAGQAQKNRM